MAGGPAARDRPGPGPDNQVGDTNRYEYLPDARHPHFLDKIYDARNIKVFDADFDDAGRLIASTDALGNHVSQDYDTANYTGTITDAKGNVTELLYNERGNVLEKREPNSDDPAHPYVTTYEYGDPLNPDKETRIVDRRGVAETRQYDTAGNTTVVKRAAGTPEESTTSYTYNTRGDVTSLKLNDQPPTVVQYDASGNVKTIANAAGFTASSVYDTAGRQTSFTDFNGNTTIYDYRDGCPCGTPKKTTYADDTYEIRSWNGLGLVTRVEVYEADGTLVQVTVTNYDEIGRVIEEVQGQGVDQMVTRKFYDGNLLDWEIIVNPESPNETPSTPIAQRKSRITDYQYDAAGRLVKQTDAEGGVVEYRYDANGNRVLLQDPVGNITTWVYDALNRMTEERDPFYWVDYVGTHSARFAGLSGDAFLAEVVAANTEPSGASAQANLGAEHVRVYAYDGEGHQVKTIDRNGRRREFEYDPLGRVENEKWYDPAGSLVRTITSTYYASGNLRTISDPDSMYTYTYDVLNRVRTVDNAGTPDMPHVVLSYQYEAIGNVTRTSDNLGVSVVSTYDKRNRLARRWWEGTGIDAARVDFFYTAAGRESHIDRYSDLAGTTRVAYTDRTYDLAGRSKIISHQRAVDDVIARYDYGYDFAGLLSHEDRSGESYPNGDWHADYTYDRTGQLLDVDYYGADVPPEQVDEYYRYDANGNRVESYLHDAGYRTGPANQLLADGTYTYEYDGEGNLVKKSEITTGRIAILEYDQRNHMTRATEWTKDISQGGTILHEDGYRYDVSNRRIQVISDSQVTKTVYDFDNARADFGADGGEAVRYLFGNRIDQVIAHDIPSNGIGWFLTDRLGTVNAVSATNGGYPDETAYSAFGLVISSIGTQKQDRFLYTGREFNREFASFYYRARFYDPLMGRFMSEDPIGFDAEGPNLFVYVGNSTPNRNDPTGKVSTLHYAMKMGAITGAILAPSTYVVCKVVIGEAGDIRVSKVVTKAVLGAVIGATLKGTFAKMGWVMWATTTKPYLAGSWLSVRIILNDCSATEFLGVS